MFCVGECVIRHLFNGNNNYFAISEAMGEVFALQSAILICRCFMHVAAIVIVYILLVFVFELHGLRVHLWQ